MPFVALNYDQAEVYTKKLLSRTTEKDTFFMGCAKKYESVLRMIDVLSFEDEPDYDAMCGVFEEVTLWAAFVSLFKTKFFWNRTT